MKFFLLTFVSLFVLSGCSNQDNSDLSANIFETETQSTENTIEDSEKEFKRHQYATLRTSQGDIVIELFHNKAPEIAYNFDVLAQRDLYDNTIFHRVIEGFMIQGGDFQNFNGTGGHSHTGGYLEDEIDPTLSHTRGMVSMANRGPNTNGSQFFIVHEDSLFLDGGYSIFGQVVHGMDVVDAIAQTPTDAQDKPMTSVVIEDIEFEK